MTLPNLLRAIYYAQSKTPRDFVFLGFPKAPGVVREGIGRGILFRPPWRSPNNSVSLTPAGLLWCRLHPLPRRKLRVVKVQR